MPANVFPVSLQGDENVLELAVAAQPCEYSNVHFKRTYLLVNELYLDLKKNRFKRLNTRLN